MINSQDKALACQSLLLQNIPESVRDKLLTKAIHRHYTRGETIFLQGEQAQNVHVVLEGRVKLYRISINGNEAIVSIFSQGQSFGEAIAFQNGRYPVSCEAVANTRILQIPSVIIADMMIKEPHTSLAILASTFRHLHMLVGQIEQMKAQTGAQRVAEFLLNLCNNQEGTCKVNLPYDKTLIAGRLGMKPESLSRAFVKLRDKGVQVKGNQVCIQNTTHLRDFIEEETAAAWNRQSLLS